MEKKSNKTLLIVRKKLKSKKPSFRRTEGHKKVTLGDKKYRKPKGIQNKIRLHKRGYDVKVTKGYKSPKQVRGLDRSGLLPIRVENLKPLSKIVKEDQGIIISRTVGLKKKLDIIKEALKLGITILNVKDPKEYVSKIEEDMKKKKEAKSKQKKEKEVKLEEKKKVVEKKEKEASKEKVDKDADKSIESKLEETKEIKEQEKKEKDKLLIKRN